MEEAGAVVVMGLVVVGAGPGCRGCGCEHRADAGTAAGGVHGCDGRGGSECGFAGGPGRMGAPVRHLWWRVCGLGDVGVAGGGRG